VRNGRELRDSLAVNEAEAFAARLRASPAKMGPCPSLETPNAMAVGRPAEQLSVVLTWKKTHLSAFSMLRERLERGNECMNTDADKSSGNARRKRKTPSRILVF
jgi:hypothetical protein